MSHVIVCSCDSYLSAEDTALLNDYYVVCSLYMILYHLMSVLYCSNIRVMILLLILLIVASLMDAFQCCVITIIERGS